MDSLNFHYFFHLKGNTFCWLSTFFHYFKLGHKLHTISFTNFSVYTFSVYIYYVCKSVNIHICVTHHHNQDIEQSVTPPKFLCVFLGQPLPYPHPVAKTDIFFWYIVLPLPEYHINWIICYVAIWVWLLPLILVHLRVIPVVDARVINFFKLLISILSYGYITVGASIPQLRCIWVVTSFWW